MPDNSKIYYTSTTFRQPRPRSQRLRDTGGSYSSAGTGAAGGYATGSEGLADGHTHANKQTLDSISADDQGYIYLHGGKAKAGWADDAQHAEYADDAAHADLADNAILFDSHAFSDYFDQPLRTTDSVKFKSLDTTADATVHGELSVKSSASIDNSLSVGDTLTAMHVEAGGSSQLRTTTFGNYTKGLITGAATGARIFESGHADFRSVAISEFLEVPELRFNRATVEIGITIRSKGGGIIEDVFPDTDASGNALNSGWADLKLEDGEIGAVSVNDLNMGFWHNETGNATESSDGKNGDYQLAGFCTVYFRIDDIPEEYLDAEKGEMVKNSNSKRFHYVLRTSDDRSDWNQRHHPAAGMHFGQIGNTNNKERQSLVISTTAYQIMLKDVDYWNYTSANIVKIDGELDGFAMESTSASGDTYRKEFTGNGTVLGNAYLYGKIDQFERAEIKLEITFEGDYMLAFGEEKMLSCMVTNGYGENITDKVTEWDISRDSGNVNDDTAWKNKQKVKSFISGDTSGTLILCYKEDDNDLGSSTSCMFSITAKVGNQAAEASLSI